MDFCDKQSVLMKMPGNSASNGRGWIGHSPKRASGANRWIPRAKGKRARVQPVSFNRFQGFLRVCRLSSFIMLTVPSGPFSSPRFLSVERSDLCSWLARSTRRYVSQRPIFCYETFRVRYVQGTRQIHAIPLPIRNTEDECNFETYS